MSIVLLSNFISGHMPAFSLSGFLAGHDSPPEQKRKEYNVNKEYSVSKEYNVNKEYNKYDSSYDNKPDYKRDMNRYERRKSPESMYDINK